MLNVLTRKASIALVFGLFFISSCSFLSKTATDADSSKAPGPLAEIENINNTIEQSGNSKSLLLKKTELFIEAAKTETLPSLRKPFYINARNTSQEGISYFSNASLEFNQILTEAWSLEHNSGVRLLQDRNEENRSDNSLNRAVEHLENAIIIQPDSLLSYKLLSTAYYSGGLYADAKATLTKLLKLSSDPETVTSTKEKIAFINLESGDTRKAASQYQKLYIENSTSVTIMHGLINAYILDNQHEKAAQLLQQITNEYPDRVTYLESLASVKYQLFEFKADSLLSDTKYSVNIETDIGQLISHLTDIEMIYDNLTENSLMDGESTYKAAGYLTNGTVFLENLRKNIDLPDSVSGMIVETENQLLDTSRIYWEQLVDLYPDNIEYLSTLYTIYNRLEMFEEAEGLEQSYNF